MTVYPQNIRDAYPEFGGFSDLQIQTVLDRAQFYIDPNIWYQSKIGDGFSDQAIMAWTAHNLLVKWRVSLNLITTLKDVYVDRPVPQSPGVEVANDYSSTVYGQQFIELRNMLPRLGAFTIGGIAGGF